VRFYAKYRNTEYCGECCNAEFWYAEYRKPESLLFAEHLCAEYNYAWFHYDLCCCAELHYAECCFADCHCVKYSMESVVRLNISNLSVNLC
jgi:hypothetical protein